MNVPADLIFSKTDEWVKLEGKIATIGISDYAQEQLSDIVFVEVLVSVNEIAYKDTTCATIESVKAAADVNLPVSGKVVEINEELSTTPERVNDDPYGKAWLLKVEINDPSELIMLMDADAYQLYCKEREH